MPRTAIVSRKGGEGLFCLVLTNNSKPLLDAPSAARDCKSRSAGGRRSINIVVMAIPLRKPHRRHERTEGCLRSDRSPAEVFAAHNSAAEAADCGHVRLARHGGCGARVVVAQ